VKNTGHYEDTLDPEESGEAAQEKDDRKWFDKLVTAVRKNKIEIPYIGRPKGRGFRLDFFAPNQLPDMALEIKEATGKRFKNLNDIHRAAHYIGMYYMRAAEVGSKSTGWLAEMLAQLEPLHIEAHIKAAVKQEFQMHFEQFVLGALDGDKLEKVRKKILRTIPCPEIREWAELEIEIMLANANEEFRRVSNKQSAQKYRDKKKQLGLRVVGGEDE